jgi:hypothetical protein
MPSERSSHVFVQNQHQNLNQHQYRQDFLHNNPDNDKRHNMSNYYNKREINNRNVNTNYYGSQGNYQNFTNSNFNDYDNISHDGRSNEKSSRQYQYRNQDYANSTGNLNGSYPTSSQWGVSANQVMINLEEDIIRRENENDDSAGYTVTSIKIEKHISDVTVQSPPLTSCENTVALDVERDSVNVMTDAPPVFLFHEERMIRDQM